MSMPPGAAPCPTRLHQAVAGGLRLHLLTCVKTRVAKWFMISPMSTRAASPPAAATVSDPYAALDVAAADHGFIVSHPDGRREAWIAVEGMVCAACSQAIESAVNALPGVDRARVSLMTKRAHVTWQEAAGARISDIFRAIRQAGYQAFPADSAEFEIARKRASRMLLWRLLVAACAMMQVMSYAFPEYIMTRDEISPDVVQLLRWAQWMITIPAMLFSAWPILANAVRAVVARRMAMDLPAAIGLVLAFVASSIATFEGKGYVWFDSVTMFVFFLLLARWLEARARDRALLQLESLQRQMPTGITRLQRAGQAAPTAPELVSPSQLVPGDVVRIPAGEVFPADGTLVRGHTQVDEAVLTGESMPVTRSLGAEVRAGSRNLVNEVDIRVERSAAESTLGQIRHLIDAAAATRPDWMHTADRWASVFLGAVLAGAALAWLTWHFIDPSRALGVAIAILIVTCPCALSLATPSAMLAATAALARRGIWLRTPGALERLAHVNRLAIDKTGTLTRGSPTLVGVEILRPGLEASEVLNLAAALAAWSRHPLSRALAAQITPPLPADHVEEIPGCGLQGEIRGRHWRLGSLDFVHEGIDPQHRAQYPIDALMQLHDDCPATWLADSEGPVARLAFDDPLRADAVSTIQSLHAAGIRVALLSGDAPPVVQRIARQAGLEDAHGGLSPQQKLDAVKKWQAAGETVMMVGDGINDGPALAGADISVSLGDATPLARAHADVILASGHLADLSTTRNMALRAVLTMRQNLGWALAYNIVSIPLAMVGYMPPWAAGLGMALSSMLVIGNSLRLVREPYPQVLPARTPVRSAVAT